MRQPRTSNYCEAAYKSEAVRWRSSTLFLAVAEIQRLRLTDAEREAVERAADLIDNKTFGDSATLRGLLERLGGDR
jgi:hypothetical protein